MGAEVSVAMCIRRCAGFGDEGPQEDEADG